MTDFCPISLCNVVYKIVSKDLANMLRVVLGKVIPETESTFVPGRLISDNAIIGLECLHALRTKKRKKGSLALKLDMSKAYDCVEWDFLSKVMLRLGFSERWVERVMGCVRTVSFSFLVNGLIDATVNRKEITGFRCGRSGSEISHLFFTDDSLFFSGASMLECVLIRRILDVYSRASGKLVNFDKFMLKVGIGWVSHCALPVSTSGSLNSGTCWKTLWGCHFPSKKKIFLWKAVRDWILTQDMDQVVPWSEEFLAEFHEENSKTTKLDGRARPARIC
ncbi:hypothetical protein Dsin_002493 [Dipteronia sinensis]|uniref:Reverse transcriptase domain-containing protein n=1 Tax=Dipteronia sinensis TaxID=43782 RepID=A0AAE0B675_9ROSI|nr:hypothetical protein Dsin_002493 [Dipteronia sinensis]